MVKPGGSFIGINTNPKISEQKIFDLTEKYAHKVTVKQLNLAKLKRKENLKNLKTVPDDVDLDADRDTESTEKENINDSPKPI